MQMTEPPSDATSGDASSAGLRNIFDDVPIMTSSFMQLGSSEAMSGFLPMTTNAFSSMEGMHGLSGPPYSALNRRSTDHSQFGVDSDDLTGKGTISYGFMSCHSQSLHFLADVVV